MTLAILYRGLLGDLALGKVVEITMAHHPQLCALGDARLTLHL